jgi:hypothetical protein
MLNRLVARGLDPRFRPGDRLRINAGPRPEEQILLNLAGDVPPSTPNTGPLASTTSGSDYLRSMRPPANT